MEIDSHKLNKLSRSLIKALRHDPSIYDLKLNKEGWTSTESVLSNCKISIEDLIWIVDNNNKSRFEWNDDKSMIRAAQGHSIDVNLEKSWKEWVPDRSVYHGTSSDNEESILKSGLNKMKRTHVHLSLDTETAYKVGSRRNESVTVFQIDSVLMHKSGHKFYQSSNGVILTDHVPARYIKTHIFI